jgi:tetratricopeptide (TPR) repeat protein
MKGRTIFFLLLPLACAAAQFESANTVHKVRVHVASTNGNCDANTQVTLSSHNGSMVRGNHADPCEVDFVNIPEGDYHLEVSGEGFTNANANSNIHVSPSGPTEFDVPVRQRNAPEFSGVAASAFVSASDLAIPKRARKELDRSNELIRKDEIQHAIGKLKKAIAMYPQYALAYNNLGVLYSRLDDREREKEALEKAISLNPTFALAHVNLGRMNMRAKDYRAAEAEFNKALALHPTDEITLILLSYSEFIDNSFDAAIATSRRAHSLEKPHAFVHRVAARAFEEEKQGANAIAELEMFLKEDPSSPRAPDARHEIDVVKATLPN